MNRVVIALGLSLLTASASAQMPVTASGTIAGVQGNRIAIKLDSGQVMTAEVTQTWRGADGVNYSVPNAPSVIVTGTEDVNNLRPGQFIQFQAKLAGKKLVFGEVTAATLVSPAADARFGILQADPVDEEAGDDAKKKPAGPLENCLILGRITKAKNGSVTVTAPGMKALSFKFAENAAIDVSGNDMSLVRLGDKITASGVAIVLPVFAAQDVRIEHSPLIDDRVAAAKLKDIENAKPGKPKNPFELGDPEEAAKDPNAPAKPKVKLELIKTN